MKKKIYVLLALSALSVSVLTACGNKEEDTPKNEQSVEVFAGATSGTDSFNNLSKGLSEQGAWIAAITTDIDASGKDLKVDGAFKDKSGKEARKLALYAQNSEKIVTKRYTLTVKQLEVNSPNFYISNGTVKGDVVINNSGFHGQTGEGTDGEATIDGNLVFKNKELLEAYNTLAKDEKVKVTGQVSVK